MITLIPLAYPETIESLVAQHLEEFFVFASEQGQDKEILKKLYEKFSQLPENKKIELRDENEKVIEYCLVSPEHFDYLNQFKWHINANGYIQKHSKRGTSRLMHRLIMKEMEGNKITRKNPINHLNHDRSDNRLKNLDIATHSENARDRTKIENCSSKYRGVYKITRNSKVTWYGAQFSVNGLRLYAYYKKEIHAAYQYNLWVDEHKLPGTKKNDIEIPTDFVPWKNEKTKPEGITRRGKSFLIRPTIDGIRISRSYSTLEQAQSELKRILDQEKTRKLQIILDTHMVKNDKGQCVIRLFDKQKKEVVDVIVDEDDYYFLKQCSMHLCNGRPIIRVNGKLMCLSRYIRKYHGDDFVDHINRNPLDNRIDNLRVLTPQQNAWNRGPAKNSKSGYVGVSPSGKKWVAYIYVDDKKINLGTCGNKEDAARKRDVATKKHYGGYGYLNFPEIVPDLAIIDAKSI